MTAAANAILLAIVLINTPILPGCRARARSCRSHDRQSHASTGQKKGATDGRPPFRTRGPGLFVAPAKSPSSALRATSPPHAGEKEQPDSALGGSKGTRRPRLFVAPRKAPPSSALRATFPPAGEGEGAAGRHAEEGSRSNRIPRWGEEKKRPEGRFSCLTSTQHHAPSGFTFSTSILYCLIARETSLPVILPSLARAAIAAWAM
jgi:hypothetical protein